MTRLHSAVTKPHPANIVAPDLILGRASSGAAINTVQPRLGGRSDKDIFTVADALGVKI